MAEQIQQVREVDSDGEVTSKTTRTVDNSVPAAQKEAESSEIAVRVIWFIAGVLLVLLTFRFVFILLGANPNNGFVDFIYDVSYPFAAPFFGMFGYTQTLGNGRTEWSTLVAMAVYALIAWGICRLITIRKPRT